MFTFNASRPQNQKIAAGDALELSPEKGLAETAGRDMATAAGLGGKPQALVPFPGGRVAGAGPQRPPRLVGRVAFDCHRGMQSLFSLLVIDKNLQNQRSG
jgi:hypothetical protein